MKQPYVKGHHYYYEHDLKQQKLDIVLNLHNLSGEANSYYTDAKGVVHTRSKHDNITSVQNAALDHAKTPLIDKLNINLITYPAVQAMLLLEGSTEKNGEREALD